MAGQLAGVSTRRAAARQAEVAERGEEDLPIGGGHQVVEDGIDGGADVEQDVGQHVEVVVEVVEVAGGRQGAWSKPISSLFIHQNTETLEGEQ